MKWRSEALTPRAKVTVDSSVFNSQVRLRCLVFADLEIKTNVIGFMTDFV